MGGERHRAATTSPTRPDHPRHPIPPSFLRRQEPAQTGTRAGSNPRRQQPTTPQHSFPSPFSNSSLPPLRGEVRWGVRGHEPPPPPALHAPITHATRHAPSFPRHPPSFLRRQQPTAPQHPFPAPFPNSSLPPSRGEVRWGVERHEPPPPALHTPITHATRHPRHPRATPRHSCAPSVIPAQAGTRAARNPPLPPTPATLRTGVPNHAPPPATRPTRTPRRQPHTCQR